MMDLKPIKDEIAEEHQQELDEYMFEVDEDGTVDEEEESPLEYLGTYVPNDFP